MMNMNDPPNAMGQPFEELGFSLKAKGDGGISRNSTEETSASSVPPVPDGFSADDLSETENFGEAQDCTSPRSATWVLGDWDQSRYELLRVLRPSSKTWACQVELHQEKSGRTVTVKRFPSHWLKAQLDSSEDASQSLQELSLLKDEPATGIYRESSTGDLLLVCNKAVETNLFDYVEQLGAIGPEREAEALQILRSLVKTALAMHARGIVHGRIRAEDTWLQKKADGKYEVVLTDFAMSRDAPSRGDAIYETPGAASPHGSQEPTEETDIFAIGVLGYALAMGRYPWFSTKPDKCKAFSFAHANGIESFLHRRCTSMSESYKAVLASLLVMDPSNNSPHGSVE